MAWRTLEEALSLGWGIERAFICPSHPDTNASASINALSGLWVCYACGAKGKVDPDNIVIAPEAVERVVKKVVDQLEGTEHHFYPESWLSLFDAMGPGEYWLSRFSPEVARKFRLGYDSFADAAVYPFRDNYGRVLGMVQRNLGDEGPKYRYPLGVDARHHLFAYHLCSADDIILVEGATDAIAAWEVDYEAMAIYGSDISWEQRKLIGKYSPSRVWVATDRDVAGDKAAWKIEHSFPDLDVRRVTWEGYKDLSEMPTNYRREVLAQTREDKVASTPCESFEAPSGTPASANSFFRSPLSAPVRIRRTAS